MAVFPPLLRRVFSLTCLCALALPCCAQTAPDLHDAEARARYLRQGEEHIAQAQQQRQAADQALAQTRQQCYQRFQVNACLAAAQTQHLDQMEAARQLELQGEAIKRAVRRAEQEQKHPQADTFNSATQRRAEQQQALEAHEARQASDSRTAAEQNKAASKQQLEQTEQAQALQEQRAQQALQRKQAAEQQLSASQKTQQQAQTRRRSAGKSDAP